MTFSAGLHFSAALCCIGLAIFGVLRASRSAVHQLFAVGMAVLALECLLTGMSLQARLSEQVIFWQRWRSGAAAFLPSLWLLIALVIPQGTFALITTPWRWLVFVVFVIPLSLVTIFSPHLFQGSADGDLTRGWILGLGWSGYAFQLFMTLATILIMVLMERILRSSQGLKRWKIKFIALGIGGVFAARLYLASQTLLYSAMDLDFERINATSILIADALIFVALLRAKVLEFDLYLSPTMLYNSFTVLVVGIYLLVVGISAKGLSSFEERLDFPLRAFVIFLTALGVLLFLLSDQVRHRTKRLISRHFHRPMYDYRKTWMEFTQRTTSTAEIEGLSRVVTKMVSELFMIPCVSLWHLDDTDGSVKLGASTGLPDMQGRSIAGMRQGASDFMRFMQTQRGVVDLESPASSVSGTINGAQVDFVREARIRYSVPLVADDTFLGFMAADYRVGRVGFTAQELDLLETIANQTAASFLKLKLSERLQQAKEMEAFQTVAAFFVHDLKNLASKLSMMMENLPLHFEDPEFRADALGVMSQSVAKLNSMCMRLSSLKEKMELRLVEADLNAVVESALHDLDGFSDVSIQRELGPLPQVLVDPEQMRKVILNLILNAYEARRNGGEIRIRTDARNGEVELAVSDNGCGMSREFVEKDLFRPFKTTKRQGMGIGLFQSKMIVEAHKGRIEVESEEGVGSTFRVILPAQTGREHRA